MKLRKRSKKQPREKPSHQWKRSGLLRRRSGWMAPLEINERHDPVGADADQSGRRASLKGFLSLPLVRYLDLLDWTGAALFAD